MPLNIAILGYKIPLVGQWDPDTIKTGLPGSEECVVYGAQELARRGHTVTVFMDPPENSHWQVRNPQWVSADSWDLYGTNYDLVFMWRRLDVSRGRLHGRIVLFWSHDSPHVSNGVMFPQFDGTLMLSKHHKEQFLSAWPRGFSDIPCTISGNGVCLSQFTPDPEIVRAPRSIGYFSNYARGLKSLISMWPNVRKKYPDATLHICYGRETWGTMDVTEHAILIEKIVEYKSIGVIEHGLVGHQELANIMKGVSIWAYPCDCYAETFCITAVKAQLAGMIPVVVGIAALNETVEKSAIICPPIINQATYDHYESQLLETIGIDFTEERRGIFTEYAKQYSWEACVEHWLNFYHLLTI